MSDPPLTSRVMFRRVEDGFELLTSLADSGLGVCGRLGTKKT